MLTAMQSAPIRGKQRALLQNGPIDGECSHAENRRHPRRKESGRLVAQPTPTHHFFKTNLYITSPTTAKTTTTTATMTAAPPPPSLGASVGAGVGSAT